jgi:hypothetical protein
MAPHAMMYGMHSANGYGAEEISADQNPQQDIYVPQISPAWYALSTASMAVSAYHGYRRNSLGDHPVAWALAWGLLGAMFPVITPVIAVAEGFGKPVK